MRNHRIFFLPRVKYTAYNEKKASVGHGVPGDNKSARIRLRVKPDARTAYFFAPRIAHAL